MNINVDLTELGKIVAREVVRELRGGSFAGLIDQHASPLGARRHIALCRKHPDVCTQVGRRFFAPRDLVEAAMASKPPKPARTAKTSESADIAAARALGV